MIDQYFNGDPLPLAELWPSVFELEKITWEDVATDRERVTSLIETANKELNNLKELL